MNDNKTCGFVLDKKDSTEVVGEVNSDIISTNYIIYINKMEYNRQSVAATTYLHELLTENQSCIVLAEETVSLCLMAIVLPTVTV